MVVENMTGTPVVQKYGGSSVATIDRLRLIAENVLSLARTGRPMVVVVSAMGSKTSELLRLAEQAAASTGSGELPQRELDMLVSTGERVTMSLLAIILQGLGCKALSLTGSQSGIITTNTHFNSRVVKVRPARILRALYTGHVAVVAGYQGMSQEGEITTLGRGGSDTTAVALASALGAESCEIYSDVDGVYTSDPRRVANAAHIPHAGYDFMEDLSTAGARVLNREAIRLARCGNVRILARATFSAREPRQTVVSADVEASAARAVAECADVMALSASAETWKTASAHLNSAGVAIEDVCRADRGFSGWVRREPVAERTLSQLVKSGLKVTTGLSLVSLVGPPDGQVEARELLSRHARPSFVGARRVSALVPTHETQTLAERLHHAYVEGHLFKASA